MDPTTLAAGAVALLSPYLSRAATDFAGQAGKAAWELAGSLLERLRSAVQGRPTEQRALDDLARNPEAVDPALRALQALFENDPSLAAEVAGILAEVKRLGPHVLVTQRIKDAEEVVGVKAKRVRGTASVDVAQDMDKARRVVGAELDELG